MPIHLLGFPWDASSSHSRGPALAPRVIETMLTSPSSTDYSSSGVDVHEVIAAHDFGLLSDDGEAARAAIAIRVRHALKEGAAPLSLGGDHSVTYPILKAIAGQYGPVNVLQIDAHPDLYDEYEGDRFSHASPFARALEDQCINNLVQVGIRARSPVYADFAESHGVVMLAPDEIDAVPFEKLAAPLYVTIDLDGLDPAFAPGVSHPEPGGLSTREVLGLLKRLPAKPVGADIVELNPERDISLQTARLAASFVKELAALMG